ncbi:P-loop NTPase fold protein [Vogesella sp. XCS3]|uniref:KAP family P-loop NTPase fold protein n=1 Tax=Vogesella sp. XCS3 TaxID=2877939 RepID=UPI001D0B1F53|nr:P-loop NTPase fold protein [Vogesella sp. XCS3]UDM16373.1 KAP family NTPase [Vogesella sp. XCS3]
MTDTAIDLPHLLTDAPARTDLLGFKPHAERLAALIQKQIPDKASFVIGIEGEWGEGKSSFINLLKDAFPAEKTDETRPTIVDFNPWWFEGSDQLLRHFFDELLGQIDWTRGDGEKLFDSVSKLAAFAGRVGKLMQLAPEPMLQTAGKVAEGVGQAFGGGSKPESFRKLRDAAAETLAVLSFKTIVFIDDLDRLPAREIVELFRVIKAVADLPNIVYVIAYDRAIVASALDEVHKGRGEAYLEKIVQLPYRLPKPTLKKWHTYNFDTLITTLRLLHGTPSDQEAQDSFRVICSAFLQLPRDAKRLLSSVHVYQLIPEQIRIDPVDFLFLEAMRLKDRRLWEQLLSAILSIRELMLMSTGGKNDDARFTSWLQGYMPALETAKPAVKDAIQHFTGWPVGKNKGLKERMVTPQRLSRLVSRVQIHLGYRSWDEEIDVLLNMMRAYRQVKPSENQFSNEAIEQFLQADTLPELAAALPSQGMKPTFFYEVIGFLQHRLNLAFDPLQHATLVAELLEDGPLEETALLGYLQDFLACVFLGEIRSTFAELNDEAKAMVTDWLVGNTAKKMALLIGFSQPGDWDNFKALAVEKCLQMSLMELLTIPNPMVTAQVLDVIGRGEPSKVEVWEAALPEVLPDAAVPRLSLLFTSNGKMVMTNSAWLYKSKRFVNLVRQLPTSSLRAPDWDAFLQKATV